MTIRQFFGIVLMGVAFLMTVRAGASTSCTSLFVLTESQPELKAPAPEVNMIQEDFASLKRFGRTLRNSEKATTLKEMNDSLHSIVVAANEIIDVVVDNIIIIQNRPLSPEESSVYVKSTETLVISVQKALSISQTALERAVIVRLEERLNEIAALDRAEAMREPIGFIPRTGGESLSASPLTQQPIGFGNRKAQSINEVSEPIAPGFYKGVRQSPTSDLGVGDKKYPMGFDIGPRVQGPNGLIGPIGFIHFPEQTGAPNKIILNLETGLFDIVRP